MQSEVLTPPLKNGPTVEACSRADVIAFEERVHHQFPDRCYLVGAAAEQLMPGQA